MARNIDRTEITDGTAARWVAEALEGKAEENAGAARRKAAVAKLQERYGTGNYTCLHGDWDTETREGTTKLDERALEKADPELYARLLAEYGKKTAGSTRTTVRAPKVAKAKAA